eukprot:Gb_31304 [translate_table: standard]
MQAAAPCRIHYKLPGHTGSVNDSVFHPHQPIIASWSILDAQGKAQYVQWARNEGQSLSSDDDFFSIKGYYKNHVKVVLTRVKRVIGIAYKDDPTIFAWELMNEPHCQTYLEFSIP